MATIKIDLPEQQAPELSKRAAAEDLSLESWFQKVAAAPAPLGRNPAGAIDWAQCPAGYEVPSLCTLEELWEKSNEVERRDSGRGAHSRGLRGFEEQRRARSGAACKSQAAEAARTANVALRVVLGRLILAAAESGAKILYTEDFTDGRGYRSVLVRNPF